MLSDCYDDMLASYISGRDYEDERDWEHCNSRILKTLRQPNFEEERRWMNLQQLDPYFIIGQHTGFGEYKDGDETEDDELYVEHAKPECINSCDDFDWSSIRWSSTPRPSTTAVRPRTSSAANNHVLPAHKGPVTPNERQPSTTAKRANNDDDWEDSPPRKSSKIHRRVSHSDKENKMSR
jgi:hypothetical protein